MKTPREILLNKHQPALPKLDAIRQKTLGQLTGQEPEAPKASLATQIWLELILPCRRVWGGLAAVWVGIIIFNLSQPSSRPPVLANAPSAAESAAACIWGGLWR